MKTVVKPLSIITTIAFVVGIIVTAIYLYNLSEKLIENSSVLDLTNIQEVKPALYQATIVISVALASGLAALVLQVFYLAGNEKENIVYVEKFKSDNSSSTQVTENEDGERFDTSSLSKEIIQKIQQVSAEVKEPDKALELALRTVCNQLEASQGAVYVAKEDQKRRFIELRASYAYMKPDSQTVRYEYGEGLAGQVAKEGISANLNKVPEGYIKVLSGLGQSTPKHLLLIPVKEKEKVVGVVEVASFTAFNSQDQELTSQAFALLGKQFIRSSEKIDISERGFSGNRRQQPDFIKSKN